jgi:hypothetical protein
MILIAVMTVGLAAAEPTTAAKTAPTPSATQVADKDPSAKLICRTMIPTGQRLGGERVCKTKADWERINRDAKDMVDSAQVNALHYGPGGN